MKREKFHHHLHAKSRAWVSPASTLHFANIRFTYSKQFQGYGNLISLTAHPLVFTDFCEPVSDDDDPIIQQSKPPRKRRRRRRNSKYLEVSQVSPVVKYSIRPRPIESRMLRVTAAAKRLALQLDKRKPLKVIVEKFVTERPAKRRSVKEVESPPIEKEPRIDFDDMRHRCLIRLKEKKRRDNGKNNGFCNSRLAWFVMCRKT